MNDSDNNLLIASLVSNLKIDDIYANIDTQIKHNINKIMNDDDYVSVSNTDYLNLMFVKTCNWLINEIFSLINYKLDKQIYYLDYVQPDNYLVGLSFTESPTNNNILHIIQQWNSNNYILPFVFVQNLLNKYNIIIKIETIKHKLVECKQQYNPVLKCHRRADEIYELHIEHKLF